jgi:hypothetical protein
VSSPCLKPILPLFSLAPLQFAGVSFIVLSIFFGMQRGGASVKQGGKNLGLPFQVLNWTNAVVGVFLIFGPGEPGPRVNVLGFQMMVGAALGFFAIYSNLKSCAQAMLVYGE